MRRAAAIAVLAVLADLGLAVASDWMFGPELANGSVRRVLEDWTLPPIDLWAVFPTGRLASTKARAFAEFVATIVNGDGAPPEDADLGGRHSQRDPSREA